MRRRAIRVLVCLHHVELWATIATNVGSITVFERVTRVLISGHDNGVESGETSAVALAEINVELQTAT